MTVNISSQIHVTLISKVTRKANKTNKRRLRQHKLRKSSICVVDYSSSSFTNYDDLDTQYLIFILLTDNTGLVNWLTISTYKCRRVVWSILRGEICTFADHFDAAHGMIRGPHTLLNYSVPLTTFTDSESLIKFIVKCTEPTAKDL